MTPSYDASKICWASQQRKVKVSFCLYIFNVFNIKLRVVDQRLLSQWTPYIAFDSILNDLSEDITVTNKVKNSAVQLQLQDNLRWFCGTWYKEVMLIQKLCSAFKFSFQSPVRRENTFSSKEGAKCFSHPFFWRFCFSFWLKLLPQKTGEEFFGAERKSFYKFL